MLKKKEAEEWEKDQMDKDVYLYSSRAFLINWKRALRQIYCLFFY